MRIALSVFGIELIACQISAHDSAIPNDIIGANMCDFELSEDEPHTDLRFGF